MTRPMMRLANTRLKRANRLRSVMRDSCSGRVFRRERRDTGPLRRCGVRSAGGMPSAYYQRLTLLYLGSHTHRWTSLTGGGNIVAIVFAWRPATPSVSHGVKSAPVGTPRDLTSLWSM